ncbi:ankyrin repeat-containing domain protein [Tricharina praecox]|uniref:ankyrin repeat-containing domain protein n=1 Tax=Tricharina praecox TaxID=43433 RepID=UPI00221FEDA4|nr:ankyrin repeat-containing domain protein [Tricharina praecox]KAI5854660.1 ankyrin repeat-containing domain protein [Tricharina praecox]
MFSCVLPIYCALLQPHSSRPALDIERPIKPIFADMATLRKLLLPTKRPTMAHLLVLPMELLLLIVEGLPAVAIVSLRRTCKLLSSRLAPVLVSLAFTQYRRKYSGSPTLGWACYTGNHPIAQSLLSEESSSHSTNTLTSLLYVCTRLNKVAIARLLLEHGADINGPLTCEHSLLHRAALGIDQRGYPEMAKLLLDWGADISSVDARHRTPLHLACQAVSTEADKEVDNLEVFRVLMVHGGADVSLKDDQGQTPLDLMRAARPMSLVAASYWAVVYRCWVVRQWRQWRPKRSASDEDHVEYV